MKFMSFLLNFLILVVFGVIISFIYHTRIESASTMWLLYTIITDLLTYLPVFFSLSLIWGLVFKGKDDDFHNANTDSLTVILYIFISLAITFSLQELLLPYIHETNELTAVLEKAKIKEVPKIEKYSGKEIDTKEFNNLKYYNHRDNIAFTMGNSLIYIDKVYKGGGNYYLKGITVIGFTNSKIDYIITCNNGKIINGDFQFVNPVLMNFKKGVMTGAKSVKGNSKFPINIFDGKAVYYLNADTSLSLVSLVDVIRYSSYLYESKVSFHQIGNIIYNKISYYVIMFILLLISFIFGAAYRNKKSIDKKIFHTVCFYITSFLFIIIIYDTIISLCNMLYGLII